jgi:hypothetical protein
MRRLFLFLFLLANAATPVAADERSEEIADILEELSSSGDLDANIFKGLVDAVMPTPEKYDELSPKLQRETEDAFDEIVKDIIAEGGDAPSEELVEERINDLVFMLISERKKEIADEMQENMTGDNIEKFMKGIFDERKAKTEKKKEEADSPSEEKGLKKKYLKIEKPTIVTKSVAAGKKMKKEIADLSEALAQKAYIDEGLVHHAWSFAREKIAAVGRLLRPVRFAAESFLERIF